MTQTNLLCCYFPSTVLFLDDNESFLVNLGLKLNAMTSRILYSDYNKALRKLTTQTAKLGEYIPKIIEHISDNEQELNAEKYQAFNIQFPSIYEEIYNENRFSLISTIFVDYHLIESTGIDFCREIAELPCTKIMLTGEAGYDIAVEAFNEGIIDKFISKDSNNLFEEINHNIDWAQKKYFHKIFDHSALLMKDKNPLLTDQFFNKIFNEVLIRYSIVEYYLLDASGSFLLLDKAANPMILTIKEDKELSEYVKIAKENGVDVEIIRVLQSGAKVPFFFTEQDHRELPSNWQDYLHNANNFIGENNSKYYYAIFPLSALKNHQWFRQPGVYAFNNHLKEKISCVNGD